MITKNLAVRSWIYMGVKPKKMARIITRVRKLTVTKIWTISEILWMTTEIMRMIRTVASTIKAPIPQMTTEIMRTIRTVTNTIKAPTPWMMSKIPKMMIEITRTIRAVASPIKAPSLWMMSKISCMMMRTISQPPRIKNASTVVCRKQKGGVVEGRKTDKIKNFSFEASCG